MNRLLDPAAVAEYLGVTVATLADWRYRCRGPAYVKVERLVRYTPESIQRYVEGSTTEPSEPR